MHFLVGFLAGVFGGLVGLGGDIMIPLMGGVLKLDQHKAHGTSLVALVFTGLSGAVVYGLKGTVDVIAAALMAATAMVTVYAGVHCAHSLSERRLRRFFGGFLISVSAFLLLKPYLPLVHGLEQGWRNVIVLLLAGACTGFLSGMMGVGGETIMIPAMVLLAGFTQHTAQGSSLLAMAPAGAAGAFTYWKHGNVQTDVLPGLIPGILIGTYLGGTLAHVFSDRMLTIVFAGVLIWTGIRYLRTKRQNAS